MKVLYAASEVLPFSSSGGLGDVIGALPKALKKTHEDYDVRVISPLYSAIREEYRKRMKKEKEFTVKEICDAAVIKRFQRIEFFFGKSETGS